MATMNDGTDLRRTARTTGLLYLGLAVTGLLGSVVIQAQLFSDGDPAGTLANVACSGASTSSRPARSRRSEWSTRSRS